MILARIGDILVSKDLKICPRKNKSSVKGKVLNPIAAIGK